MDKLLTNRRSTRNFTKLASVLLFAAVVAISNFGLSTATTAQNESKQEPAQKQAQSDEAKRQSKETRFDNLVRDDFFAGIAGDQKRFDKGMKFCEETLAKNPKHAEAMVWHGGGVFTMAGWAFQKGDLRKGGELWQKGMDEMNAAVALEPENVGVLIPRAAVLFEASKHVPMPAVAREMLETAVNDYEKVLKLQQSYFQYLSTHARGELLIGLASGWHRLGDQDKARAYFLRLAKEFAGTTYAERATAWLEKKTLPQNHPANSCTGCHAR
jgi:tetratricopeptide (TPR) repeat protein